MEKKVEKTAQGRQDHFGAHGAFDEVYTAVKPRELLKHLQAMCVGLHAMDVLNLQNEMQTYHEDMEGIPEYIKKF